MTRDQAKEMVKENLESYLSDKGINANKPFICLNPDHADTNPSMSYDRKRQKAHCFSCGADYDTFDLIGIDHNLSDHADIFNKAYDYFNIKPERQNTNESERYTHKHIHTTPAPEEVKKDLAPYFKEAQGRINKTTYAQDRGISDDVIRAFNLGYDPNYSKGTGGAVWEALIIPTSRTSYIARNINPNADKKNRYRKQGGSPLYNTKALRGAEKPVFIVEGELDALSIITVGGEAVALGSTANTNDLIKRLKEEPPAQPLLIALDNDDVGQKAGNELIEGIRGLDIPFYRLNPYNDYKDANGALMGDKEAFIKAITRAENIEAQKQEEEREAYEKTNAANRLQDFINGIAKSVNTPCIATGFNALDAVLEGGLFEGLYIMGAISSLGKTTLALQIIDQIAQSQNDILIFSLEMARSELMAKSISRHTLLKVLETDGRAANAKTARGITTGKRYEGYSKTEKDLITEAIKDYSQYANHIYINEGIGDIGTTQIREAVKKHILLTGKTPVVVIDYLQILAPYNERATDKQNTDKAVMELKRISRDYKLPIIGISSFNRANYSMAVTMEAFKESGAIEYSSDVLIGLQLKGAGQKEFDAMEAKNKDPREVELVILKNRNGAAGTRINFEYYPLFNYFKEI